MPDQNYYWANENFEHIREWSEDGFTLDLFDTHETTTGGKCRLAYHFLHHGVPIFHGDDFGCSPMHAIDSDKTVQAILGFLSLKPGDTDEEYFDDYTPHQLEWAEAHGEELGLYAQDDVGLYGETL